MIARRIWAIALVSTPWLAGGQTVSAQSDAWRPLGPDGGYVYNLAIDPQTPATLYAAVYRNSSGDGYGVFKSTDGGSSWNAINAGLPQPHPISTLAVDPLTPTTLYAGWNYSWSGGVFRSTDGGGSWSATGGFGGNQNVRALAIDPRAPTTVYAGTSGEPPFGGVFGSLDSGGHWTAMRNGLPHHAIGSLAIDPQNTATVYAGTYGGGLYKSTDGGSSWSAATSLGWLQVYALAVDPNVPTTVYAGTRTNGEGYPAGGVYKTTDGGATWTISNSGLRSSGPNVPFVMALALDPQAPATLYAGLSTGGVFKSTDGGASWAAMNQGLTNLSITTLAVGSQIPTTLYAGTYGGGVFAMTVTPSFVLSVGTTGDGTGTVTSTPSGIDCGADCSESYRSGTTVTLTATPASHAVLTAWNGCDAATDTTCTVRMDAARSVTAVFDLRRFVLTVRKSGVGTGTVTSDRSGIDCGSDCYEPYAIGTAVTLTATQSLGLVTGWTGCDANSGAGTTSTCTVTMTADKSITANFVGVPITTRPLPRMPFNPRPIVRIQ